MQQQVGHEHASTTAIYTCVSSDFRTRTLLHERGIDLSASQVHRLVTGTPEWLSLPVLAALCDILEVTPTDLVVTTGANVAPRKAVAGEAPAPVDLATVRPRRARVRPD